MAHDLYRKLQRRLDTMSVGFPPTESGIELKILKKLFSEKDATLFLALSPQPRTPEAIAADMGGDATELTGQLQDMASRGLLYALADEGVTRYCTIAYVHGIYEFQLTRMDKEMTKMFSTYFDEALGHAMFPTFVRPVPRAARDTGHTIVHFIDGHEVVRSPAVSSNGGHCDTAGNITTFRQLKQLVRKTAMKKMTHNIKSLHL